MLRERIEVVSQNEAHYRELIITDLDDLRLRLSQASFDDELGDSRDVTKVYRQVLGEGMEHEDLQKVCYCDLVCCCDLEYTSFQYIPSTHILSTHILSIYILSILLLSMHSLNTRPSSFNTSHLYRLLTPSDD